LVKSLHNGDPNIIFLARQQICVYLQVPDVHILFGIHPSAAHVCSYMSIVHVTTCTGRVGGKSPTIFSSDKICLNSTVFKCAIEKVCNSKFSSYFPISKSQNVQNKFGKNFSKIMQYNIYISVHMYTA
jgi:hypothetical protein